MPSAHSAWLFFLCSALCLLLATSPGAALAQDAPTSGRAEGYEKSIAAGDLLEPAFEAPRVVPPRKNPFAGKPATGREGIPAGDVRDPLIPLSQNRTLRTPSPDLRFNGASNPNACGGCTPPDAVGDVGPNHYVQMVNATKVSIYTKTGTLLKRFNLGTLWSSGPCRQNLGDPIVRYDEAADRWLLSQFNQSSDTGPFFLCFAISETGDPTGAYHLYRFRTPQFPDYFKVGVWPAADVPHAAYYVGTNENSYTAYAFDRTKMLVGDASASFVRFPRAGKNFVMPADVDGSLQPTGGGLFYTFTDAETHNVPHDRLEIFQLTPDFLVPANSTFQRIEVIRIASFKYTVCGFFILNCIPQKGTTRKLDAISEWPMQRLAYRRFADHESMVGNFTVGAGSATPGAAIRWFEVRNTGSGWSLFQQGTLDFNDGHNRFMGSIAMDQAGNIALGYSVSSATLFPSVRYVTRNAGAPLGTMDSERSLQAGRGSQTGSNRWGDYSSMAVDPVGGCQFWYTNEYYASTAAVDWRTIVGAFRVATCTPTPVVARQ